MTQVIIANELKNGFVVFLTEANHWSNDIAEGAIAKDVADAESLLKKAKIAEQNCEVIDPYLIEINIENGRRVPTEYREFIRAHGPSVPIPS